MDTMIELPDGTTVADVLHRFAEAELLPGTGVDPAAFWAGLGALVHELGPRNRDLLEERTRLQAAIDDWHRARRGRPHDQAAYVALLEEIGYLQPEGPPFTIATSGVDREIATVAGPQLVVPATNARYALNAANARWGSLYDALYGTDALGDPPPAGGFDPARGARVVAWARAFLDDALPLRDGSHVGSTGYRVVADELEVTLADGRTTGLADGALVGWAGAPGAPERVVLVHHGLHVELVVDATTPVGAADPAGIADVVLESAVSTIVDCEDSVATVDADDKVVAYRNWLGLLTGTLTAEVVKGGRATTRRLAPDRTYDAPGGATVTLPGRALLLVRTVGLLTTTPAVRDRDGREAPEGLVDALFTVAAALHDLRRGDRPGNARAGSVYVVKPKLHGPDEVAFADAALARVEAVLGLPAGTVKVGLMDEERRTSVNLRACIRAAASRVAFINTGFLDRTGDEIHTSMQAGPMVRKADMRTQAWIAAYEDANVDVGLACGLGGRAQIGKGMWAAPDRMAAMLAEKIAHPRAGASCAWVPSPTAATLHATHYHRVDVAARQAELAAAGPRADRLDLLRIPVADQPAWSDEERRRELENNAQGILGYVVRWVDQGVGCSKVPDLDGVALMEDRATCRISSQHMANWLHHGVVGRDEVLATMRRMAEVVDAQNAGDPAYVPMAPDFDGPAFNAAVALVLGGLEHPSGYTEPVLHARRAQAKAAGR